MIKTDEQEFYLIAETRDGLFGSLNGHQDRSQKIGMIEDKVEQ